MKELARKLICLCSSSVFLGTKKDMEDIVAAIVKIQKQADILVKV